MVVEAEGEVKDIQEKPRDTQSRQKSYLIREGSLCNSKTVIMSIFEFHQQRVYTHFPHLAHLSESRVEILFKGGRL